MPSRRWIRLDTMGPSAATKGAITIMTMYRDSDIAEPIQLFGFTEYGTENVTQFFTVPSPQPAADQVLITLRASGVNPADIKVRNGERQGSVPVEFPMAMGREAAGTVLAVGENVSHVAPGDRVFGATAAGSGSFAERVLLSGSSVTHTPDGVSDAEAASIPVSVGTAYDALEELDLPAGSTLLVLGAGGGVGTAVCGLAKLRDIRVLGVASATKKELVESLRAEHVEKGEGWVERVQAVAPDGVDAIIDAVGGETLRAAAQLLKKPGAIRSAADHQLASDLGGSAVRRRRTTTVFAEIAELINRGSFSPALSESFDFFQAAEAVAQVESGHAVGNVVITRSE